MKTHRFGLPKSALFFAVAFLALQATPAAAADSGSGTYVGRLALLTYHPVPDIA